MILVTITTDPRDKFERFSTFLQCPGDFLMHTNIPNVGLVPAMHAVYEKYKDHDIIAYVHNDVSLAPSPNEGMVANPNWRERVLAEFENPNVAIVGFGGATGIGVDDIYKTRYQINQLQRINYASNQTDWDTHGAFEDGSREVAVLDGFFLAIRTSFLKQIGGFKSLPMNFHGYDLAICLLAIRHGYLVKMVGINCTHHGGGTSTTPDYKKWCLENGTTMEREHEEPHLFLYNEFRDMLPFRVWQSQESSQNP